MSIDEKDILDIAIDSINEDREQVKDFIEDIKIELQNKSHENVGDVLSKYLNVLQKLDSLYTKLATSKSLKEERDIEINSSDLDRIMNEIDEEEDM